MNLARLSYLESCRQLSALNDKGEPPRIPDRLPHYDDDETWGINFFRELVRKRDLSNLTLPRTYFGRSQIEQVLFRNTDFTESNLCWKHRMQARASDRNQSEGAFDDLTRNQPREQHSERRIDGQGVVLLRCGEAEEDEDEADPDEGEEADFIFPCFATFTICRAEALAEGGEECQAPGEEPDKVQEPEPEARDGVVIARVAHVQKAQQLLVDEKEPQETVILARAAVHAQGKIGRITQRRQNVPRSCD